MRYKSDGSIIPSKIHLGSSGEGARELFGVYRGVVLKTVYPDDPKNTTKERVEYVVKVNGQEYPNAINMRDQGGIYNYHEKIRKGSEKALKGEFGKGTFDAELDGEHVYVMFIAGHSSIPLIIGAAEHARQAKYKKHKKADGVFDEREFNGVQFQVDKDSNYTIKQVGRKDKDGAVKNTKAKDAFIRLGGIEGDVILKSAKNALVNMDKDGSVQIISKDGSMLSFNAKDGSMIITTKDGNSVTATTSGGITVAEKTGKAVINLKDGTAQVTAKKVLFQSEEASFNSGTTNIGTNAAFHAVLYEMLKIIFDGHTHATVLGPSGPPLPPMTMALMEASPATSAQAMYVKLRGNI